ncbi:unnamed protein product [Heligmosomoides polygyrus]|uniref:Uncharacterized protein n=1 Tax=Heligmosomoides polygyrus TaxID=6339 RepID=A0A183FP99_HELPZ|nr:unnamed protein product [Heligmosomoides polygyrus]
MRTEAISPSAAHRDAVECDSVDDATASLPSNGNVVGSVEESRRRRGAPGERHAGAVVDTDSPDARPSIQITPIDVGTDHI